MLTFCECLAFPPVFRRLRQSQISKIVKNTSEKNRYHFRIAKKPVIFFILFVDKKGEKKGGVLRPPFTFIQNKPSSYFCLSIL